MGNECTSCNTCQKNEKSYEYKIEVFSQKANIKETIFSR